MIKRFWKWYDSLKEPWRFLWMFLIIHPVMLIGIFPIYGIIGLIMIFMLIWPRILY